MNTTGAIVKGMFGHSSVYDPVTNKVLVHGGYSSESSAVYFLQRFLVRIRSGQVLVVYIYRVFVNSLNRLNYSNIEFWSLCTTQ